MFVSVLLSPPAQPAERRARRADMLKAAMCCVPVLSTSLAWNFVFTIKTLLSQWTNTDLYTLWHEHRSVQLIY